MSSTWPPEIARWLDHTTESTERVLLEFGKMLRDLPNAEQDVGLRQFACKAAREYVEAVPTDQRAARLVIVCKALGLQVAPGSTEQLTAEAFIAKC